MTTVRFVTANDAKVRRAQQLTADTDLTIEQAAVSLPEHQTIDVEDVSRQKAQYAAKRVDPPLFVSDTGYHIDALDGFPGALLKPVLETIGVHGLCRLMEGEDNRQANFVSVLTYIDQDGDSHTFTCNDTGRIAQEPHSEKRQDWGGVTQIHIPDGFDQTLAGMSQTAFEQYEEAMEEREQYIQLAAWLSER